VIDGEIGGAWGARSFPKKSKQMRQQLPDHTESGCHEAAESSMGEPGSAEGVGGARYAKNSRKRLDIPSSNGKG